MLIRGMCINKLWNGLKVQKRRVKYIRDRGYYVFVATNQSGIAESYYTQ